MPEAHDTDPRLVARHDLETTRGTDDDRCRELVGVKGPGRVADLGCGTGRLARGAGRRARRGTGRPGAPVNAGPGTAVDTVEDHRLEGAGWHD